MGEGAQLLELCKAAESELLLVAPFITPTSLERVLGVVKNGCHITLVTRWQPVEIAQGFNSLVNRELVLSFPNGRFLLRQDLHAKYYQSGDSALVGSSNLTGAGLGWSAAANLELLVRVPSDSPQLRRFVTELMSGVVDPDDELVRNLEEAVDAVEDSVEIMPEFLLPESATTPVSIQSWVPSFPSPRQMWHIYQGNYSGVTSAGLELALDDLSVLRVGQGLDKNQFNIVMRSTLEQMPLVLELNRLLQDGDQPHEVLARLLATRRSLETGTRESKHAYNTLLNWLLVFFPGRYQFRESEIPGMLGLTREGAD